MEPDQTYYQRLSVLESQATTYAAKAAVDHNEIMQLLAVMQEEM